MLTRLHDQFVSRKRNNAGAGMVSVIIAMAFVAVLGSIVMSTSFLNYRMKQTNLRTKNSFYTAEQAVNEVSIGLQNIVSESISAAYIEVLENYAVYSVDKKKDLMESVYFTNVWNALQTDSTHTSYKLNVLQGFLKETAWTGDLDTGHGALLTSATKEMITYDQEGIVLKDLQVYFRDAAGYVSIIKTDIKLALPELQFASNTVLPDITTFNLVADNGLAVGQTGENIIKGNLYAKELQVKGNGVIPLKVTFQGGNQIILKDGVILENAELFTDKKSEFWTTDITIKSSTLTLQGESNIADDLNLTGTGSRASIEGTYNGYGNKLEDPDKSSAILLNGTDAVVNLNQTKIMILSGHAFVGTKDVNQGSVGGVPGGHGSNVLTGESLAVKSNQLLYLIPPECIGVQKYKDEAGSTIYGKSLYGKNPITAAEYQEIISKPADYEEFKADIIIGKLGKPLSNYTKYTGGMPQTEKVFLQGSRGTMVYYYMSFVDEAAANQYFKDYYGLNAPKLEEHMNYYTNGIKMKNPIDMLRLQLGGNALKFEESNGKSLLQENTVDSASTILTPQSLLYENMFRALCTKLVKSYTELINLKETDITKNIVFDNLVDKATLKSFTASYGAPGISNSFTFTADDNSVSGILVDNEGKGAYVYDGGQPNLHLIIATGDVKVNQNYKGLILADGTITLKDGIKVEAEEEKVKEVLKLHTEQGGAVYNLMGFLWDGAEFLNISSKDDTAKTESVQLEDLIVYENWLKE